jgi:hypothetical protein
MTRQMERPQHRVVRRANLTNAMAPRSRGTRRSPRKAVAGCCHDWIKQPDQSYLCWKCGAELPPRAANDKLCHAAESERGAQKGQSK